MTWRRSAPPIDSRLNRRATLFAGMWRLERCEVALSAQGDTLAATLTQMDDKGEAPCAFSRGDCQASGSHIEASRGCLRGLTPARQSNPFRARLGKAAPRADREPHDRDPSVIMAMNPGASTPVG